MESLQGLCGCDADRATMIDADVDYDAFRALFLPRKSGGVPVIPVLQSLSI